MGYFCGFCIQLKHPEMDHAEDEVHPEMHHAEDEVHPEFEKPDHYDQHNVENEADEVINNTENNAQEDPKWWDSESQNLLDSQQLVEGLSLCDDLLQSQSPIRAGHENGEPAQVKPRLADYAKLGPENLKKDLEECQNIVLDPANIMLEDTPPDFRLSQLVSRLLCHLVLLLILLVNFFSLHFLMAMYFFIRFCRNLGHRKVSFLGVSSWLTEYGLGFLVLSMVTWW